MNKENCALKLVDEIILYYDARSTKHQITGFVDKVISHVLRDLHVSRIQPLKSAGDWHVEMFKNKIKT